MSDNTARPSRDNPFARAMERLINASDKTQTDIAEEIGYENQNMITMFKSGRTRVPMEKVVPLCEAIGADSGQLLRLWFNTYMPGALATIEQQMGSFVLSNRERAWVRNLRRDFGDDLPVYDPALFCDRPRVRESVE